MAQITVNFTFHSGIKRSLFGNVRLSGSWDAAGRFSNQWAELPMAPARDETGCDAFQLEVQFDAAQAGTVFQWGVVADMAGAPNSWAVVTEVPDENSFQRYRSFVLSADGTQQDYWFATGRRFGAQKCFASAAASPNLRFAVWAPHAAKVEVVFGLLTGYIADDGDGIDPSAAVIPLSSAGGGVWTGDVPGFHHYLNHAHTCIGSPTNRAHRRIRSTSSHAIRSAVEPSIPAAPTIRAVTWT